MGDTGVAGVRAAYDTVAEDYERTLRDLLVGSPFDRALLGVFGELVTGGGGGLVGDLGCGPGRVTGYLRGLGLDVFGLDLSPGMVEVARRVHPDIAFDVGTFTDVDRPDGGLAGIVAWYSIIHTPPDQLPAVFAEFHRLLAPGGRLALAFQVGDERVHVQHAYGHDVDTYAHRLRPDAIAERLTTEGFTVHARLVRDAAGAFESTPQAYLLAHR